MSLDLSRVVPLKTDPYPYNELQLAWLEDLERGGKKALNVLQSREGGNCCLGRLCVVAGLEPEGAPCETPQFRYDGELYTSFPPKGIAAAARLISEKGSFVRPVKLGYYFNGGSRFAWDMFASLSLINDTTTAHFQDIAAYIRLDPWNVFVDPNEGGNNAA